MGITLLSVVLLGLAAASAHALQQASRGQRDVREWAGLQSTLDSLIAVGGAAIVDGSTLLNGQSMTWAVSGTNPRQVLIVHGRMSATLQGILSDTVVLYLPNP